MLNKIAEASRVEYKKVEEVLENHQIITANYIGDQKGKRKVNSPGQIGGQEISQKDLECSVEMQKHRE